MTVSEGRASLAANETKLLSFMRSAVAGYAQYGGELPQVESAIEAADPSAIIRAASACLDCAPGCDLPIVNPHGPYAGALRSILRDAKLLRENRRLEAKLEAFAAQRPA